MWYNRSKGTMENICTVERLNSIRNEMTHLWGGIFATTGGSIALFLSEPTLEKTILGVIGLIFALIMSNAYLIRRNEIVRIIRNMESN